MAHSFSHRTAWELSENRLNILLERLRSQNIDILDLTESNPTRCDLRFPSEIITALQNPKNLDYAPESRGMRSAREVIAREFSNNACQIDPESIVLTASTSEAYTYLLRLLVNPGERVLTLTPGYPLFRYLIELADAVCDSVPLQFTGRWGIDFDALNEAVTPATRVLIVINPNNPTGSYLTVEEVQRLNAFCRQHRLSVISDEVFFDFAHNARPQTAVSLINNQDVLTFVLGGLSKTLALPQMKLSWLVTSGPRDDVKEALVRLEMIADTYLSVNSPSQNALGSWWTLKGDIQKEILARVKSNFDVLNAYCQSSPIKVFTPEGGWQAVIKIPGVKDEERWILNLLEHQHVLVHPGYFFDFKEEGYMVLSLLTRADIFRRGLEKISSQILR